MRISVILIITTTNNNDENNNVLIIVIIVPEGPAGRSGAGLARVPLVRLVDNGDVLGLLGWVA